MPSYTGLFRSNAKKKIMMECFNDTLPKAIIEFEEYAKNNNLVFIRAYLNTPEKQKKKWKPAIKDQAEVIHLLRHKRALLQRHESVLNWLIEDGQVLKTPKGYRLLHG